MKVIMDDLRLNTIDQIKELLKGSRELIVRLNSIDVKYKIILCNKSIEL